MTSKKKSLNFFDFQDEIDKLREEKKKEEQDIMERQIISFTKENKIDMGKAISLIRKAKVEDSYLDYCDYEHNDLARNKFSIFMAKKILDKEKEEDISPTPSMAYRSIKA